MQYKSEFSHLYFILIFSHFYYSWKGFPGGSVSKKKKKKNLPANAGDVGSITGSGRSPGEGNGNPLQYSCLGNSMNMNTGACQATVRGGHKRVGHDLATKQQQYIWLCQVLVVTCGI